MFPNPNSRRWRKFLAVMIPVTVVMGADSVRYVQKHQLSGAIIASIVWLLVGVVCFMWIFPDSRISR